VIIIQETNHGMQVQRQEITRCPSSTLPMSLSKREAWCVAFATGGPTALQLALLLCLTCFQRRFFLMTLISSTCSNLLSISGHMFIWSGRFSRATLSSKLQACTKNISWQTRVQLRQDCKMLRLESCSCKSIRKVQLVSLTRI
jgi:hypothetical protein